MSCVVACGAMAWCVMSWCVMSWCVVALCVVAAAGAAEWAQELSVLRYPGAKPSVRPALLVQVSVLSSSGDEQLVGVNALLLSSYLDEPHRTTRQLWVPLHLGGAAGSGGDIVASQHTGDAYISIRFEPDRSAAGVAEPQTATAPSSVPSSGAGTDAAAGKAVAVGSARGAAPVPAPELAVTGPLSATKRVASGAVVGDAKVRRASLAVLAACVAALGGAVVAVLFSHAYPCACRVQAPAATPAAESDARNARSQAAPPQPQPQPQPPKTIAPPAASQSVRGACASVPCASCGDVPVTSGVRAYPTCAGKEASRKLTAGRGPQPPPLDTPAPVGRGEDSPAVTTAPTHTMTMAPEAIATAAAQQREEATEWVDHPVVHNKGHRVTVRSLPPSATTWKETVTYCVAKVRVGVVCSHLTKVPFSSPYASRSRLLLSCRPQQSSLAQE